MNNVSRMMAKLEAGIDRSAGPDGCWPWTRGRTAAGYGRISYGTKPDRNDFYTHRLVAEQANGPIPDGQVVRHTCDNPPCCNPAHLIVGTQSENIRDAVERGRQFSPGREQSECLRGHPFDSANTYLNSGRRHCRACMNIRQEDRRSRA